ncbi:ABC transporter substrate-binding protein [Alicyclobacillus mengziensis]|uniref:Solute-binding protein family 5 domain-containing protein n=1 Tax=Alicyclobacillus mengziensis TaxID=2931921 RepID=A0A9X7W0B0_9BACL|nr:ABC transporter substrate-binding protein [Alicyclobacillus mengziensis]QSO47832.1 hypothetical protein JZ786_01955 [Alicyclobacillus mengziensis]
MKRAALLAVLATAGAGLLVVGCGGTTSNGTNAAANTSGGTSAKQAVFTTIDENHAITAGAPLNPFNANGNTFLGYDVYQLGWSKNSATNVNAFYPGLAASWTVNSAGTKVTVTLQPNAKWSDGTPVTANDIKTSMAIAFTQGNAQAFYLGSVKTIGSNQVEFDELPGQHYNLFLANILEQAIVPASVYGSQLPSNIWTIIDQANYQGTNPTKVAAAKSANSQLTAIGKKIASFSPAKDVSAGPFVVKSLNPGEAVLTKNPYFYNASNVKVDQVVFRNYTGNQQIWNYLIGGQLDAAPFTAMPSDIMTKILATKSNQKVVSPSYVAAALAFNESTYPYNMLQVRQALAYIINRNAVQKVAEPAVGTVDNYTDGMVNAATQSWLTSSQISQMHKYAYNTAKATQLLQQAGFKKQGNQWIMPNGKPWTATIYTVNGFNDWIEAAKVMSTEMSSFGIQTSPQMISSYPQYLKELAAGKYAIGFWLDALGPAAYNTYARIYGVPDGYNIVGGKLVHYPASDTTKGNWIGLPQTVKLPDGTTVNPGQLTNSLNSLSQAQQKPVVQQLALATNENVPLIELWDYINVQFVNNSRFTDFPTSPGMLDNPPGVWIGSGYVQPK